MQPQQPNGQPMPVPIQSVPMSQPIQPVQPMLYGQPQPMMGQSVMISTNSGNGSATTGLVMGILGLTFFVLSFVPFLCFFFFISWIFGILAVVFGHVGYSQAKTIGVGEGQGITGFVLGYLTIIGYVVVFLFWGALIDSIFS
ncbi:MAG: hypothetical protein CMA41_05960 [Euryarchaeota archaeon]|jgi:hypothetical protein|nr:hypothetical protein [Euryarchaeota archaeon]MBF14185.1 hypothetical protein [Euryarchaeota archaeon]|tara:strand:- start:498 stop:923 length:426 start_codon:yes stop_codon:yes gene_type:complete